MAQEIKPRIAAAPQEAEQECIEQQRLRRENASLRAALNATERKLDEAKLAAPALSARPGEIYFHPRADADEMAERDFFRYLGRVNELAAQYPHSMVADEDKAQCREALPRHWATRGEHADWLVFKHIHGEGFGPRWASMNGLMMAIDNLSEHPMGYFAYTHRSGKSRPSKELALPPAMCTNFRKPWGAQEYTYLKYNVSWTDDEGSGDDSDGDPDSEDDVADSALGQVQWTDVSDVSHYNFYPIEM